MFGGTNIPRELCGGGGGNALPGGTHITVTTAMYNFGSVSDHGFSRDQLKFELFCAVKLSRSFQPINGDPSTL